MNVHPDAERARHNWLIANNGKHMLHPMLPQHVVSDEPPIIIDRAEGVFVYDLNGKGYIDCQGGLWCVNAGHGRQEIKDAIVAQLDKLQYYTNFPGSTVPPAIELSAKLVDIAKDEGIKKVFFGLGGSDAVESALKIARQYWKIEGEPERIKFISLRNGYHGLHFGGTAATGGNAWKRNYEPLTPGFINVESPFLYRNPFSEDSEELSAICLKLLEREIEFQMPDTIAALVAEPIQGAGGVIVPPASYWPGLRALCDQYGILLIADEVITGFGRSGALFGSRGWGVKPDMMCVAKGLTSGYLPLGATLVNGRISDTLDRKDSKFNVFMQGYTYSGHPVSCAAGMASLDIVLRENLAENAGVVGDYLIRKLQQELYAFAPVGDIRGKGLMICIELVKDRKTKEPFGPTDPLPAAVSEFCVSRGVMIRTIGHKMIISPPLTFTKAHADQVVDVLRQALKAAQL